MPAVPTRPETGEASAYRLRIDLQGFKPPIWRRVVVPAAYSFKDLHELIQVAFEWDDSHLHEFEVDEMRIGDPATDDGFSVFMGGPGIENDAEVRLHDLGLVEGKTFTYTYDFGDDWRHKIKVEAILHEDTGMDLPACVKGRRAAPLEDSGTGPLEEMFEGDPAQFDPGEMNARLSTLRRKWAEKKTTVTKPGEVTGAPEHLFWLIQDDNRCVSCQATMRVGRFDVTVRIRGQDLVPTRMMGHRCGSCNILHMHIARLVESLIETEFLMDEIEGFSCGDQDIPASLLQKEKHTGEEGYKLLPWEKIAQTHDEPDSRPPSNEQIAAIPAVDAKWIAETRPIGWIEGEDDALALAYLTLLVDQDQAIRGFLTTPGAPPAERELTDFLKKAFASPNPPLEPGRPRSVELGTRLEAARPPVAAHLQETGIKVETGPALGVDEAFDSFDKFVARSRTPPVLLDMDPRNVLAFLDAGERFLDAQPWRYVEPDAFLGVRLGDEPERPLTMMGHMGEEFGYLILDSWEDTNGFMEDVDAIDTLSLEAPLPVPMGRPRAAMESVTLTDLTYLHPLDGEYLASHGFLNPDEAEIMLPLRMSPQGPLAPGISLEDHERILQALTRLLPEEDGGETRSTTVDGKRVTIRIVEEVEKLHEPQV